MTQPLLSYGTVRWGPEAGNIERDADDEEWSFRDDLLDWGDNIDIVDEYATTDTVSELDTSDPESVTSEAIVWADSDVTFALWSAISSGDESELVDLVQKHGERKVSTVRSADGRGPLFWAFEYEQQSMVDMLLSFGADPSARDAQGMKPKDLMIVKAIDSVNGIENTFNQGGDHGAQLHREKYIYDTEAFSLNSTAVKYNWHPCVDPDPEMCANLVAQGLCFGNMSTLDYMWSLCPSSCNVCPKAASPSLYSNNDDMIAEGLTCDELAARGDCWNEHKRKKMYQYCTKACVMYREWKECIQSQVLLNAMHPYEAGKRYSPALNCEVAPKCRAQCISQQIISEANMALARLESSPWQEWLHDDTGVPISGVGEKGQDALLPDNSHSCIAKASLIKDRSSIVKGAVEVDLHTDTVGLLWAFVEPVDEASFCAWEMLTKPVNNRAGRLIEDAVSADGSLQKILAPAARRAVWRPLTVTAAQKIRLYPISNPEGRVWTCNVKYMFKGARHPSLSSLCSKIHNSSVTVDSHSHMIFPSAASWYPPQSKLGFLSANVPSTTENDTQGQYSVQTGLWLAGFPFASSIAHNIFILLGESPRISYNARIDDKLRGIVRRRGSGGLTHSDCIMSRCSAPMQACYSFSKCRSALNDFFGQLKFDSAIPHWLERDIQEQINRSQLSGQLLSRLEDAVKCFFLHCECQPLDFDAASSEVKDFPVALYRGAISAEEISIVKALGKELRSERASHRSFGVNANGHFVTQLDPEFSSRPDTAAILAKLKTLAVRADIEKAWHVVDDKLLKPRTIELLEYPGEYKASLGWHQDTQSAVTVLLMMSDRDMYEGGNLQHQHLDIEYAAPLERHGDVAVYRSHQYHMVTDTTAGLRLSLAIEFWHVSSDDPLHFYFWGEMEKQGKNRNLHDGRPIFMDASAPFHDVCPR